MSTAPIPPDSPSPNYEPHATTPMNEIVTSKPLPVATPEQSLWKWLTEPTETQWLLPAAGAWILGLDWFLFSQETISLGLAVPATAVAGFLGGTIGTWYLQTRFAGDRGWTAAIKAVLAGIVVGIPVPLAGSFVGGWILLNSGLASVRDRVLRNNKQ